MVFIFIVVIVLSANRGVIHAKQALYPWATSSPVHCVLRMVIDHSYYLLQRSYCVNYFIHIQSVAVMSWKWNACQRLNAWSFTMLFWGMAETLGEGSKSPRVVPGVHCFLTASWLVMEWIVFIPCLHSHDALSKYKGQATADWIQWHHEPQ